MKIADWFQQHAPKLAGDPLIADVPTCKFPKCRNGILALADRNGIAKAEAERIAKEFWAWHQDATFCARFFGEVCVVNLRRRRDRLRQFRAGLPQDFPWPNLQTMHAIDGKHCKPPGWWGGRGGGAWGCFRSHMQIIEACLNQQAKSVLIFEDDAIFCDDFTAKLEKFLRAVPDDWGMLYLGGQHLHVAQRPPTKINAQVWRPWNVNRTHAFAIHRRAMQKVYHHLLRKDWTGGHHIDHHLGRLHNSGSVPVYCPPEWLVGQASGHSNIAGRQKPEQFWQAAQTVAIDPAAVPFVAVVGLHSSGSSAVAGLLWHLGVHLGNDLVGYYGNQPGQSCGYEARGLMDLCEAAVPFPGTAYKQKRGKIWGKLRGWIDGRRREAAQQNKIAGGKYPQLCRLGDQLRNIAGERLFVVNCRRPIEQSIESMVRRTKKPRETIEAHQRWLDKGRDDLMAAMPPERVATIDYDELLADPARMVGRLCDLLPIEPSTAQVNAAIASIDPAKRHVGAA